MSRVATAGLAILFAWNAARAEERQPLYYQDPSGKPDYSPTPKKDTFGGAGDALVSSETGR